MRRLFCAARHVHEEAGFTLVEALVAALVLTVGLLTVTLMLIVSTHASAAVRAKENAVTLARQITEDARSIPYSQISGSTLVSTLQGMSGLGNHGSGSTWTIKRNSVIYTVTTSVTPVYDAKDPTNAATPGTTVDLQQIGVTVSWTTFQGKTHQVTETTTVSRAGQDPGLIASGLQLTNPAWGTAGVSGTGATAPIITSTGITSLQFSVNAPPGTTAIVWSINGGKQSSWNGSAPSSGNTWTSAPWSLSGVSDGTYTISAQAEDSGGVDGPAVTIPVRLIRNVPSAPNVTSYGFNSNFMVGSEAQTVAELQWASNPELNVIGYRVYNPKGTAICTTSTTSFSANCGANAWCFSPTVCTDLNGGQYVNSSTTTYTVKALYYDANNNLQEGSAQAVTLTSGTPVPPPPVPQVSLTAITQPDNTAVITWSAPSGGTPVSFYWIYRDGDNYSDRYDTLAASSCTTSGGTTTCTYHDTNRTGPHSYYVSAVGGTTAGANMAESQATGPVSG